MLRGEIPKSEGSFVGEEPMLTEGVEELSIMKIINEYAKAKYAYALRDQITHSEA